MLVNLQRAAAQALGESVRFFLRVLGGWSIQMVDAGSFAIVPLGIIATDKTAHVFLGVLSSICLQVV